MKTLLKTNPWLESISTWEPNCWINIETPSIEDISYLTEYFGVPDSFLTDIEDIDERPRYEVEEGWTLIILRVPYRTDNEENPFITVPLGVIFKDDICITVCFYRTKMIEDFIFYMRRKNRGISGNFDLIFRLFLSSSVWYLKYLKQINANIKEAEYKLEKSIRNRELQNLLKLENCLVYFMTSLRGNDILFAKLKRINPPQNEDDTELVEDIEIELKQAQDSANIYSDILSGMMDAYASVISNNVNEIMKRMTMASIVLMIPTLVASFYGMNVPNMFSDNSTAFVLIVCISLSLSAVALLIFRKWRWF